MAAPASAPSSHPAGLIHPSPSTSKNASLDERVLAMLGKNIPAENVASALGIDASRVSQLVSDPAFAERLQELRYSNLSKHNERDESYDTIEDKLTVKLDRSLALLTDPMKIVHVLSKVNAMKRRGVASSDNVSTVKTVVQLMIPVQLMQKFSVNINNQVVSAGSQDLITVSAGKLDTMMIDAKLGEKDVSDTSESTITSD